jgi:hypothetical protein
MKQIEMQQMLNYIGTNPDSDLGDFIFHVETKPSDLLDFITWVDENTIITDDEDGVCRYMADSDLNEPQSFDMLVKKYLLSKHIQI